MELEGKFFHEQILKENAERAERTVKHTKEKLRKYEEEEIHKQQDKMSLAN